MSLGSISPATQAIRARAVARAAGQPGHHAVFDRFEPFSGWVEPGFHVDYLGSAVRETFTPMRVETDRAFVRRQPPPFDEEYFEWIDLLEAVSARSSAFVMFELGAGFGRWSGRAARAARQIGRGPIKLVLVEAEPVRAAWARLHMADQGLAPDEFEVIEAGVAASPGSDLFYVRLPEGSAGNNPREWRGQSLVPDYWKSHADNPKAASVEEYFGREVVRTADGAGSIRVPLSPLSALIAPYDEIDLIDMDVQGVEAEIVAEAIGPLTQTTHRLHIGTHASEIEMCLRETLHSAGWVCQWDLPLQQSSHTDFGSIQCGDGVQSWVNPRFWQE